MAKSTNKKDKSLPNTSEADIYLTDASSKNITLSVRIGPAGQRATSHVKLDQDLKLKGHDGTLDDFAIDSNLQCKNKFLSAATTVTAMKDVNNIDVVYVLKGGPEGTKTIPLWSGLPVNQGQSVLFDITVFLF